MGMMPAEASRLTSSAISAMLKRSAVPDTSEFLARASYQPFQFPIGIYAATNVLRRSFYLPSSNYSHSVVFDLDTKHVRADWKKQALGEKAEAELAGERRSGYEYEYRSGEQRAVDEDANRTAAFEEYQSTLWLLNDLLGLSFPVRTTEWAYDEKERRRRTLKLLIDLMTQVGACLSMKIGDTSLTIPRYISKSQGCQIESKSNRILLSNRMFLLKSNWIVSKSNQMTF